MVKFSIITVCYNAESCIEETIKSIIDQNYKNYEYIVVDGASEDNTVNIIKQYSSYITKWVSEPDNGIYDAMNKGISMASGEWINFMNAGDVFADNNVLRSISSQMMDADIVYGDTMLIYSIGKIIQKPYPLEEITNKMVFGHQATFVKGTYHKKNIFDTSFKSAADFKFLRDSYINGARFQYIPVTVVNYEAENGVSARFYLRAQKENAVILKKDKDMKWRISFAIFSFIYTLKFYIKKIMPSKILVLLRKRNLSKYNSTNL